MLLALDVSVENKMCGEYDKIVARIEAGVRMREFHERRLEVAASRMRDALLLTGNDEEARRLAPDAFEAAHIEERKIREIDEKLEELRSLQGG